MKIFRYLILILPLFVSVRALTGYYYRYTTTEDVFICKDITCFNVGHPQYYDVLGKFTGVPNGNSIALYACPLHPLGHTVRFDVIDRPNPITFLLAVIPFILIIFWIKKKISQQQLPNPSKQESNRIIESKNTTISEPIVTQAITNSKDTVVTIKKGNWPKQLMLFILAVLLLIFVAILLNSIH